jgi:hypothetical protein
MEVTKPYKFIGFGAMEVTLGLVFGSLQDFKDLSGSEIGHFGGLGGPGGPGDPCKRWGWKGLSPGPPARGSPDPQNCRFPTLNKFKNPLPKYSHAQWLVKACQGLPTSGPYV